MRLRYFCRCACGIRRGCRWRWRDLEADEDEQELDGRGHQQHADSAEEDEGEELTHIMHFRTHGIDRGEQSDEHGTADEQVEEDAEGVGLHDAVVGGAGREVKLPRAGCKGCHHGQDAEPASGFAACGARQQGIDQHDEDAGEGKDDLGEDACELHGYCASPSCDWLERRAAPGWFRAGVLLNECTPRSMARIQ